jgi:hypothetical protein
VGSDYTQFHGLSANTWSTTQPTQKGIYCVKQLKAATTYGNFYGIDNDGTQSVLSSGSSFTSNAYFAVNKVAFGTIKGGGSNIYASIGVAWAAASNTYGQAFLGS